jgi:hypothetical protein
VHVNGLRSDRSVRHFDFTRPPKKRECCAAKLLNLAQKALRNDYCGSINRIGLQCNQRIMDAIGRKRGDPRPFDSASRLDIETEQLNPNAVELDVLSGTHLAQPRAESMPLKIPGVDFVGIAWNERHIRDCTRNWILRGPPEKTPVRNPHTCRRRNTLHQLWRYRSPTLAAIEP